MLDLFVFGLCVALVAVVWAVVLVDTGMLLEGLQRWVREWHRLRYMRRHLVGGDPESGPIRYATNTERLYYQGNELEAQWWWKPVWGCSTCVAGQLALWGYLLRCYLLSTPYNPWHHLLVVCGAIFHACLLKRLYNWSQS
ncbi:hypothetical protein GCM10027348_31840 [Hymenobacter tenuis]